MTRSHLAHARVLADSFREHHPGWRFVALIVDDPHGRIGAGEPFEALGPEDVGVDVDAYLRAALMYRAQGRTSSLKATLMRALLDQGAPVVLLFDADIAVYASLEAVAEQARLSGVVLSPHIHEPAPTEAIERALLASGVFNGGFVACGPAGRPFLDWWAARSRSGSGIRASQEEFFSQKWLTLAASLFEHHVLRDRGCNVMGWNLSSEDVAWRDDRPWIAGTRLRFFHYAGSFDPERPDRLATDPSVAGHWPALDERPGVARLCEAYAAALVARGYRDVKDLRPGFAELGDGTPVDDAMRVAYQRAILERERGGADRPWPPNPFDGASPEDFVTWLNEAPDGVSRYLLALRELRADLRAAYPAVPGADAADYLLWATLPGDGPPARFRPDRAR